MDPASISVKLGQRVFIKDKDASGVVSYVGLTEFAPGKWIGVTLDEPKGKNNGSVQGRSYFQCQDKHGVFVRQTQVKGLDGPDGGSDQPSPAGSTTSLASRTSEASGASATSPKNLLLSTKDRPKTSSSPAAKKSPGSGSSIPAVPSSGGASRASMGIGSRLPTAAAAASGPTQGRSPSFTNLRPNLKTAHSELASSPGQSKARAGTLGSSGSGSERSPAAAGGVQSGIQRERSFVEPNFVKNTQVQVQTTPPSPASTKAHQNEDQVTGVQAQLQLQKAKEDITELEEKLETLKLKRAKDLEKLKEYEKARIQLDQMSEFKTKIMESQAALQRELQKARHEAREAVEARERHAEEMAELTETVEMATLDKEMAEEKAETLQMELESAKERVEELTLDLELIKAEMSEDGATSGGSSKAGGTGELTNFEVKQLKAQNEKLRETLVKMRDLSAHEKSEIMRLTKDLEERKAQVADLGKKAEKLEVRNVELETTIGDLQEQVDAALGAEEMVENLTVKCLDLEDRMVALTEEKKDLETLHEMDEELLENLREAETELREEIDLFQGRLREMARTRDAAYEIIHDHEATIVKFRDLVARVQDQNSQLRAELRKDGSSEDTEGDLEANKGPQSSDVREIIDFQRVFQETKAHSRAIDMELRSCEAAQANRHVSLVTSYMPARFTSRGGDNEAILVLLLVPRMVWKAGILSSQVRDMFVTPASAGGGGPAGDGGGPSTAVLADMSFDRESFLKGPGQGVAERLAFGNRMIHLLNCLGGILARYGRVLSICDTQTFLRVGSALPELSAQERSGLDFYIDLLRKNQLDENVPWDPLEKCLSFFGQMFVAIFEAQDQNQGQGQSNCHQFLNQGALAVDAVNDYLKSASSALDCAEIELALAKAALQATDTGGNEFAVFLKTSEGEVGQMRQLVKSMKRRLPQTMQLTQLQSDGASCTYVASEQTLRFPASDAAKMERTLKDLGLVVRTLYVFGRSLGQLVAVTSDAEAGLPPAKLLDLLTSAIDEVATSTMDKNAADVSGSWEGLGVLRTLLSRCVQVMTDHNRSLQDGDWDLDGPSSSEVQPQQPVALRAEEYKAEAKESEGLRVKLESKDEAMRDLKRAMKEKSEELSEMNVRKDKAEKKLSDAARDAELMREKLQRKLDDAQALLVRKEKEYEETMDLLQSDIDSLESEKGELKLKLKKVHKQALMEGLSQIQVAAAASASSSSPLAGVQGPASMGPSVPTPVRDSPMLVQRNRDLQMALLSLKEEAHRKEGQELKARLMKMKPLHVMSTKRRSTSNTSPTSSPEEKKDASKEDVPTTDQLLRRVSELRQRIDSTLMAGTTALVDLPSSRPTADKQTPRLVSSGVLSSWQKQKEIRDEADQLRLEVARLVASRRPGGQVDADFCKFPTPQLARALNEHDYRVVARLRTSAATNASAATPEGSPASSSVVPVVVGFRDLGLIHGKVMG